MTGRIVHRPHVHTEPPDGLLDGTTVPWDFLSGDTETTKPTTLPTPQLTPEQTTRRRLIIAGRWTRP